jgi:predicted peptidase
LLPLRLKIAACGPTISAAYSHSIPTAQEPLMPSIHLRCWIHAAFVVLLCASNAVAEEAGRGFQLRTLKGEDGKSEQFVIFVPQKAETPAPIILSLHGSGERGTNVLDPVLQGLGPAVWKQRNAFPAYVVFPQCRPEGNWKADGADANRALAMLKQIQDEFGTDPDRVYLTGLSMGGSGTWSLAEKYPDKWAAIVPMCSRGKVELAEEFAKAKLPIWNFCGDQDRPETVEFNRQMHEALTRAGAHDHYTEYPGVGHNCWDKAYSEEKLYTWMFKQHRSTSK